MKYRIINNKKYTISILRFEIPAGVSEIECTSLEANILGTSNGFIVEKIIKKGEDINLLKKK